MLRRLLLTMSALLWAGPALAGALTGTWSGTYAACGGSPSYKELVQITHVNGYVIARKTVGNACVPRGSVSFFGRTASPANCFLMRQNSIDGSPAAEVAPCLPIRQTDATHFTAINVIFTKVQ